MEGLKLIKIPITKKIRITPDGVCPFCGKDIDMDEFKDTSSKKEFELSGLCQSCQDDFFDN